MGKMESCIEQLCEDNKSGCRRFCCVRASLLIAIVLVVFLTSLLVFLGFRPDVSEQLLWWGYLTEMVLLSSLLIGGVVLVVLSGIPGRKYCWVYCLVKVVFLLWVVLLATLLGQEVMRTGLQAFVPGADGWHCMAGIIVISLIPAVLLFGYLKRREAPTRFLLTGFFVGFVSSLLGVLSLHFVCPMDLAMHKIIWHLVPVVLVSIAVMVLGNRLLRW